MIFEIRSSGKMKEVLSPDRERRCQVSPENEIKNAMILAKVLKDLIKKNGHTVSSVARATGVSQKTIHNWLTQQKPRNIEHVKRVADFFNVSVDHLCFGPTETSILKALGTEDFHAGQFEVILRPIKR